MKSIGPSGMMMKRLAVPALAVRKPPMKMSMKRPRLPKPSIAMPHAKTLKFKL